MSEPVSCLQCCGAWRLNELWCNVLNIINNLSEFGTAPAYVGAKGPVTGNLFKFDWSLKFVFSGELKSAPHCLPAPEGILIEKCDRNDCEEVGSKQFNSWSRERIWNLFSRNTNIKGLSRPTHLDLFTGDQIKEPLLILKRRDSRSGCRKAGLFFFAHSFFTNLSGWNSRISKLCWPQSAVSFWIICTGIRTKRASKWAHLGVCFAV